MDDKFVRLNLRREHFPKFAGLKLPHDLTVAVKASGVTMVAKPMNVIYDDKDPNAGSSWEGQRLLLKVTAIMSLER
jgi:hypothetical protein